MANLKPLCTTCERIFSVTDEATSFNDSHHTTAEELKQSVDEGCFICKRLYNRVKETQHDALAKGKCDVDRPLFDKIRFSRPQNKADWWARRITVWAFDRYHEILFDCISKEVAEQLGLRTSLDPSIKSPDGLKQASMWLENCQKHHIECNRRLPNAFVPTRLVHVERLENDSVTSARLVTGASLPPGTRYLSLSHCWGGVKFLTLTQANLHQFQITIPVAELTAVFQDALYVAYQLGVPYVWIDSLCIIQDSPADWEHESQLMGEVYKRAVCNLSASAFNTGIQGFFAERTGNPSNILALQVDTKDGQFNASAACPEEAQFYLLDESVLHGQPWREICSGSLFERAWVLQEQILALRVLHFGKKELFWECKENFANETWATGWANLPREFHGDDDPVNETLRIMGDAFRYFKEQNPLWQFMVEDLGSAESSDGLWRRVVQAYSARSLTYPNDRLPALSGIATEFNLVRKHGQYLLGQWTDDLVLGLLWTQSRPFPSPANALTWPQVPSWSWVSLNSSVDWYIYDLTVNTQQDPIPLCRIIEPTPLSNSHAMTLIGNLMRLGMPGGNASAQQYIFNNGNLTLSNWTFFSWQFYLDQWFFESLQGEDDKSKTYFMLESMFFIPLLYRNYRQVICLVLLPLPDSGRGFFRRAGVVHMYNPGGGLKKDFTPTAREYQHGITEEFYQDYDGEGNYRIAII